jgi:hypothetical protein
MAGASHELALATTAELSRPGPLLMLNVKINYSPALDGTLERVGARCPYRGELERNDAPLTIQ